MYTDDKFNLILDALGTDTFLNEVLNYMGYEEEEDALNWIIQCWGLSEEEDEEEEN